MNHNTKLFLTDLHPAKHDDCACPDHGLTFSLPPVSPAGYYQQTPQTHLQHLPGGFVLLYSPFTADGPAVVNEEAWAQWQKFQQPHPLGEEEELEQKFLTHRLIQPVGIPYQPNHSAGETLTAWLHVTNACNLDCPYCYVRKSSDRMSEEVGEAAVRRIFHTAHANQFKRVKLKYAGGEATLHFKLVQHLHLLAQQLSVQYGLELQEIVLSNGYHITDKQALWLRENQVQLMISLDGIGENHDQQRPLKGGGRTFAQIEKTVDQILIPNGLKPYICTTVTQLNAATCHEVVRWALTRELHLSLNFYRPNIQTASRQELELEEQTIIAGLEKAYAVFEENLPTYSFLNGLLDRVQAEAHTHTCGVQQSYVVMTHTGQLAQCQMHLEQAEPIPADNLLPIVKNQFIQNLSVDHKQGCRSCEFRYRCTGGCPLETYRATGRWDVQSPHCRIYKTLWPQALRLEGLRLIKIQNLAN